MGKWHPSGCVIDQDNTVVGIEELSVLHGALAHVTRLGCWHNGFNRPVLKHGPRSLTCLRVFGWKNPYAK